MNPVVVLDAGVLDRVVSNQEFRGVLRDLVEDGWDPILPAVVLAEVITGRAADAPANQLVRRLGTVETSEGTARQAGRLRFDVVRAGVRRTPSGIDAIVAAHAWEAGSGVVFTTDPTDLRRLLADAPHVSVERP